jgi:hypothetical protein
MRQAHSFARSGAADLMKSNQPHHFLQNYELASSQSTITHAMKMSLGKSWDCRIAHSMLNVDEI